MFMNVTRGFRCKIIFVSALTFLSGSANTANVPLYLNASMFDNTTPNVYTNITERVCIFNYSDDPDINAATVQSTIIGWLNESTGWEMIGTTKINFIADCSNPNIRIEFLDLDDPEWTCAGAACAPYPGGSIINIDGINRRTVTGIRVGTPFWTCNNLPQGAGCFPTSEGKKGLINHEMGHMVGLDHSGPVWGVTSGGPFHEQAFGPRPTVNESYQARAHLNGRSSPAINACVGFPSNSQVLVSWFDTANDDTNNEAALFKNDSGWQYISSTSVGQKPGIGGRVNALFNVGSVGGFFWTGRADVIGGPRNQVNWDPVIFPPGTQLSTSTPNTPCTFLVEATGDGDVSLTWKDASVSETDWHLYYSIGGDGGSLGPWKYRGACSGENIEGCGDSASFTTLFSVGDRLCARIAAGNSIGLSGYSNIACTIVE